MAHTPPRLVPPRLVPHRLSPQAVAAISRLVLALSALALLGSIALVAMAMAPAVLGVQEVTRRGGRADAPDATLASLIDRQAREAAGSSGAVLTVIAARIDAAVAAMEAAAHEPIGLLDGPRGEMLVGAGMLALLALIGGTVSLALHLLPRLEHDDTEVRTQLAALSATVSGQLNGCAELIAQMREDSVMAMEQLSQAGARLRANTIEIEQRVMSGVSRALEQRGQTAPIPGEGASDTARLSLAATERTARHLERLERAVVELVQSLSRREGQDRTHPDSRPTDQPGEEATPQMAARLGAIAARIEAAGDGLVRDAQLLPAITGRLSQIQATLDSAAIRLEEDVQRAGERQAAALETVHERLAREVGGLSQVLSTAGASIERAAAFLAASERASTEAVRGATTRLEAASAGMSGAADHDRAIAALASACQDLLRQMDATVGRLETIAAPGDGPVAQAISEITSAGLHGLARLETSHQAMSALAERCEALLTRLEAEAAAKGEERTAMGETSENRSVASRLLADLARRS